MYGIWLSSKDDLDSHHMMDNLCLGHVLVWNLRGFGDAMRSQAFCDNLQEIINTGEELAVVCDDTPRAWQGLQMLENAGVDFAFYHHNEGTLGTCRTKKFLVRNGWQSMSLDEFREYCISKRSEGKVFIKGK